MEVEIRFGDAAEEIIASAEDCDLVVMATHGRGAAGRLVFGSTADRVARHGSTPTLLIRAGAHPIEPVSPRRVVVPLDGSPLAEQALPEATKLAKVLGSPIHLVRAVGVDEVLTTVGRERGLHAQGSQPDETSDAYEQARIETERQATDYLAAQAGRLQDVDVTTELLRGTPAFALLWMIEPEDIVVMTTHGLGGYRRWMIGSVAEKLVREAAAPVLLVRDKTGSAPRQPVDSPSSA